MINMVLLIHQGSSSFLLIKVYQTKCVIVFADLNCIKVKNDQYYGLMIPSEFCIFELIDRYLHELAMLNRCEIYNVCLFMHSPSLRRLVANEPVAFS